jgi:hypothetical protein
MENNQSVRTSQHFGLAIRSKKDVPSFLEIRRILDKELVRLCISRIGKVGLKNSSTMIRELQDANVFLPGFAELLSKLNRQVELGLGLELNDEGLEFLHVEGIGILYTLYGISK